MRNVYERRVNDIHRKMHEREMANKIFFFGLKKKKIIIKKIKH